MIKVKKENQGQAVHLVMKGHQAHRVLWVSGELWAGKDLRAYQAWMECMVTTESKESRGNKERMDLWAYLVHLDIWENLVR